MGDAGWKQFERRMASKLGGKRRGPDVSDDKGGKTDIILPPDSWGVECKLLGKIGYADILAAVQQAERNSGEHQTPIAITKRKRDLDDNALVSMRLKTWLEWYGPSGQPELDQAGGLQVTVPKSFCPKCGAGLEPTTCRLCCPSEGCDYSLNCSDLGTE